MKTLCKAVLLAFPLLAWLGSLPFQTVAAQENGPTPTYGPLAEPPLPPHPTELELGGNLYWHWCMPCHGDRGQGLTDEFRGVWEPDHQNCWGRGCHAGRQGDAGFPIPTVVPSVADESHLARFASVQALAEYLQATHPPQSPGSLETQEYHAIALFVFSMNGRRTLDLPASTPTETLVPFQEPAARPDRFPFTVVVIPVTILILIVFLLKIRARGKIPGQDSR